MDKSNDVSSDFRAQPDSKARRLQRQSPNHTIVKNRKLNQTIHAYLFPHLLVTDLLAWFQSILVFRKFLLKYGVETVLFGFNWWTISIAEKCTNGGIACPRHVEAIDQDVVMSTRLRFCKCVSNLFI
jgi:hypothetical protein